MGTINSIQEKGMAYGLTDDGRLDRELVAQTSPRYRAPKIRNGKTRYVPFAKTFGLCRDREDRRQNAYVATNAGFGAISVRVKSQFWKMIEFKENRSPLLMCVHPTLKDPDLVIKKGEDYHFYKSFYQGEGKNGKDRIFSMISVCKPQENGEMALMTNYIVYRENKIARALKGEMGNVVYQKPLPSNKKKLGQTLSK